MIGKWPFNPDEYVQLIWIKSPFRNPNKEWMVPLILRDNSGQKRVLEIPWGLFPDFRLGQYYANGVPVETYKDGSIIRFELESPDSGTLCHVADLPEGLVDNEALGIKHEYVWVCEVGQTTLCIPCIEVVRSLLAPNATLARALLDLDGLNLIANYKDNKLNLDIIINQTVPRGLVTDAFIYHLAWILTDPIAKRTWNYVLLGIRPRGDIEEPLDLFEGVLNDDEIKPKKLKAILPLTGRSIVEVRGIQKGDHFLVFEIVSAGNLVLPFENITYSKNPVISRRIVERDESHTTVKRIRRKKKFKNFGIDENPSNISKTIMSQSNSNILSFENLPKIIISEPIIEKERRKRRKKHSNKPDFIGREPLLGKETQKKIGDSTDQLFDELPAEERLFSGAEVLYTGNRNVHPYEFHGPSILNLQPGYGLDLFFNAIDCLNRLDTRLTIFHQRVGVLPVGKKISFNEDGGPRKYALVMVKFDCNTRYIVEVERLRKLNLSTLIIEPRDKAKFEESDLYEIMGEILVGLVKNYGNWDKNQLQNQSKANIHQVKHLDQWAAFDWAIALYNRLSVPSETG